MSHPTNLYYRDARGDIFEFEASTAGGTYAWFRNLRTDESVRLPISDMTAVPTDVVLAIARV